MAGAYPLILDNPNNNTIQIFKGWDHLPLGITPENQDIHAVWSTYNLDAITFGNNINLSSLSAGELYKLCNTTELNKVLTNQKMEIQMGYDGIEEPDVILTAENSNGEQSQIINLQDTHDDYYPFNNEKLLEEDKEFTIAIDYRFNIENSPVLKNADYAGYTPHRQSILMSCYYDYNSSISGFKLYYDLTSKTSNISFGDSNTASNVIELTGHNDAHDRNIIVIRHPKNSTYAISIRCMLKSK